MLSSVNMGRRKLRLRVCKYGERRHSESEKEEKSQLIVSIELTSKISVLRVSLPREMYLACPVGTLPALGARLKCQRLPPQWYISDSLPSSLRVFKMHEEAGVPEISCTVQSPTPLLSLGYSCNMQVTSTNHNNKLYSNITQVNSVNYNS